MMYFQNWQFLHSLNLSILIVVRLGCTPTFECSSVQVLVSPGLHSRKEQPIRFLCWQLLTCLALRWSLTPCFQIHLAYPCMRSWCMLKIVEVYVVPMLVANVEQTGSRAGLKLPAKLLEKSPSKHCISSAFPLIGTSKQCFWSLFDSSQDCYMLCLTWNNWSFFHFFPRQVRVCRYVRIRLSSSFSSSSSSASYLFLPNAKWRYVRQNVIQNARSYVRRKNITQYVRGTHNAN